MYAIAQPFSTIQRFQSSFPMTGMTVSRRPKPWRPRFKNYLARFNATYFKPSMLGSTTRERSWRAIKFRASLRPGEELSARNKITGSFARRVALCAPAVVASSLSQTATTANLAYSRIIFGSVIVRIVQIWFPGSGKVCSSSSNSAASRRSNHASAPIRRGWVSSGAEPNKRGNAKLS